jgi:hypothetical protein
LSAVIALLQRNSVHLLTDAAAYFEDGTIGRFRDKCQAIPELQCAFTTIGSTKWSDIILAAVCENFASFDEIKAGIEPLMRDIFEAHRNEATWPGNEGIVYFIGWSKALAKPEALTVMFHDVDEIKKRFGPNVPPPFKIDFIDVMTHTPCPTAAELEEARLPFSLKSMTLSARDELTPLDLLHLMEVQRRVTRGNHIVGGWATLTSIDASGVSQRRLHTWKEDKVGEMIKPLPIDWVAWRAERDAAKVIPMLPLGTDMQEQCIRHAMIAASDSKIKSLDPSLSGIAMIAEGLRLIFPVDSKVAYNLAGVCCAHAGGTLLARAAERKPR